jgi:hypothetical protein
MENPAFTHGLLAGELYGAIRLATSGVTTGVARPTYCMTLDGLEQLTHTLPEPSIARPVAFSHPEVAS